MPRILRLACPMVLAAAGAVASPAPVPDTGGARASSPDWLLSTFPAETRFSNITLIAQEAGVTSDATVPLIRPEPRPISAAVVDAPPAVPTVLPRARPEGLAPAEALAEALDQGQTPALQPSAPEPIVEAVPSFPQTVEEPTVTDVDAPITGPSPASQIASDPIEQIQQDIEASATQASEDVAALTRNVLASISPPVDGQDTAESTPEDIAAPQEEEPQVEILVLPVTVDTLRPRARPRLATVPDAPQQSQDSDLVGELLATELARQEQENARAADALRPRPRPGSAAAIAAQELDPDNVNAVLTAMSFTPRSRPAELSARAAAVSASRQAEAEAQRLRAVVITSSGGNIAIEDAATTDGLLNMDDMSLIGIFGSSSTRRALIRLENGSLVRVREGGDVDGWRVVGINGRTVRLLRNGRTEVLELPG